MIKNILFDVGNVLLDFDPERFLREAGYTNCHALCIYASTVGSA